MGFLPALKDFPIVDEFCCGWSLKTGVIAASCFTLGKVSTQLLFIIWNLHGSSRVSFLSSIFVKDFYQKIGQMNDEELYNEVTTVSVLSVIFIVIHVFTILVSLLLIKGATTEKTDYLMPWIVVSIFECYIKLFVIGMNLGGGQFAWGWFLTVGLALQIYFVAVVLSFRKQIQASGKLSAESKVFFV